MSTIGSKSKLRARSSQKGHPVAGSKCQRTISRTWASRRSPRERTAAGSTDGAFRTESDIRGKFYQLRVPRGGRPSLHAAIVATAAFAGSDDGATTRRHDVQRRSSRRSPRHTKKSPATYHRLLRAAPPASKSVEESSSFLGAPCALCVPFVGKDRQALVYSSCRRLVVSCWAVGPRAGGAG